MLKNISWSDYWTFIAVVLVIYYATICCLYYLDEVKQIVHSKSNVLLCNVTKNRSQFIKQHEKKSPSQNEIVTAQEEMASLVKELTNEITNAFKYASSHNLIRQEIIYALQQIVSKYSSIKNSPFKSFATNHILTECANYCSIHLSEEDLRVLWT